MDIALSVEEKDGKLSPKSDLVDLDIFTHEGDHYHFSAMSKSALEKTLPKGSNRRLDGSLTLVNASTAILMIPMRIIKKITVEKEVWWGLPV